MLLFRNEPPKLPSIAVFLRRIIYDGLYELIRAIGVPTCITFIFTFMGCTIFDIGDKPIIIYINASCFMALVVFVGAFIFEGIPIIFDNIDNILSYSNKRIYYKEYQQSKIEMIYNIKTFQYSNISNYIKYWNNFSENDKQTTISEIYTVFVENKKSPKSAHVINNVILYPEYTTGYDNKFWIWSVPHTTHQNTESRGCRWADKM